MKFFKNWFNNQSYLKTSEWHANIPAKLIWKKSFSFFTLNKVLSPFQHMALAAGLFSLLWILPSLSLSAGEKSGLSDLPEEFRPVAIQLLKILQKNAKEEIVQPDQITKNLLSSPSLEGEIIPVVSEKKQILVLWNTPQFKVILAWTKESVPDFMPLTEDSLPEHTQLLSPAEFDLWLLSDTGLFNQVINNTDFLKKWIPSVDPAHPMEPRQFLSYLFSLGRPERHYNLAAVMGEDKFFTGITENDQELRFLHLPLLHYALSHDHVFNFCKIQNEEALKNLPGLLEKYWADASERNQFIQAFGIMLQSLRRNTFADNTFIENLKTILAQSSQKYEFSNISSEIQGPLITNMKIFMESNGIASFQDLQKAENWFKKEITEQFLMAKTTAFFRDWREMKFLKSWFLNLDKKCTREKRPLKIKVFGCSTGQEALSYAFELLGLGINQFTILATDIDSTMLAEAEQMMYSEDKFQVMPLAMKKQMLENYFEKNEDGNYQVRFKKYMQERIHYQIQDITQPLAPQTDPNFNPPYDLISVKNILLYLDKEVIDPTFNKLKTITAPNGILIVKDKRYNAHQQLNGMLKDFIGISSFMAIRPASVETNYLLGLYEMFSHPLPPQWNYLLYNYGKAHRNNAVATDMQKAAASLSPWNLYAQQALLSEMISKKNAKNAQLYLSQICRCDPLYFFPLYSSYRDVFPGNAFTTDENFTKASEFAHILSSNDFGSKSEELLEKELTAWACNTKLPMEVTMALAQILTARDLGRYSRAAPSSDGKWIQLGIKILDFQLDKNFQIPFLEHKAQLTDHFLYFIARTMSVAKKNKMIQEVLDPLLKVKIALLSLNGRLSLERLCGYLVNSIQHDQPDSALSYLDHLLSFDELSEEELDLLTDRDYSDHFELQGDAHFMISSLKKSSLTRAEKKMHLLQAVTAFDKALEVDTVYGYRTIQARKLALEKLEELEKT
jgi:chemotaxis methyl-accepting protein methylase